MAMDSTAPRLWAVSLAGRFLRKLARVNPWLLSPPSDDMRMCISEALSAMASRQHCISRSQVFSFIGLMKWTTCSVIGTFLALTRFSFSWGWPPSAGKQVVGQPFSKFALRRSSSLTRFF